MSVLPFRRRPGAYGERTPPDADSEEHELRLLTLWLKQHSIAWTRIQGPRLGALLVVFSPPPKLRGVTTGLLLSLTRRGAPPNVITPDIVLWHDRFATLGWRTAVAFGAADAMNELEDLGYGR